MAGTQSRRSWLQSVTTAALAAGAGTTLSAFSGKTNTPALKGNILHSVCSWTYNFLSLDELCHVVKDIGFAAIDLVGPKDWHILKRNGVDSSMCNGAEISLLKGWNDPQYHNTLVDTYTKHIDLVAAAVENVVRVVLIDRFNVRSAAWAIGGIGAGTPCALAWRVAAGLNPAA